MIQDNLFNYKNFLYLRWSVCLVLIVSLAYALDQPKIVANGGTWLGYTLGTIGAALIVWLIWFGVRKRQYASTTGQLRGWVSAHVYLGLALAVVGTLHTGFQIGWNVHSLAYVLMMATIVSGLWGLVLYVRYPREMSDTLNRKDPKAIVEDIEALDKEVLRLLKGCPDNISNAVNLSTRQLIFNSMSERRSGLVKHCATEKAIELIEQELTRNDSLADLYKNQVERLKSLRQLRRYYKMRYWLDLWLAFHVPLSVGLLAALTAHIVSVFYYW